MVQPRMSFLDHSVNMRELAKSKTLKDMHLVTEAFVCKGYTMCLTGKGVSKSRYGER